MAKKNQSNKQQMKAAKDLMVMIDESYLEFANLFQKHYPKGISQPQIIALLTLVRSIHKAAFDKFPDDFYEAIANKMLEEITLTEET
jgi:hypothetical protein